MNKDYVISKEHCQKMIGDNVCTHCGGVLVPLETEDGGNPTFWVGCESCRLFNSGTSKKIFEMARALVTKKGYRPYSHLEAPEDKNDAYKEYWLRAQTSGMVSLVQDVLSLMTSNVTKY